MPGVYTGGALALNGTLTLDAQGDPGAVFVLRAASTLITGPGSVVALVNGADACNVFWQVTSSATLGTSSVFAGNVLALTSITADTGAVVSGRLLARNAAVTLDRTTVTRSTCAAPAAATVAPTATATAAPTPTAVPTASATATVTPTSSATATGTSAATDSATATPSSTTTATIAFTTDAGSSGFDTTGGGSLLLTRHPRGRRHRA